MLVDGGRKKALCLSAMVGGESSSGLMGSSSLDEEGRGGEKEEGEGGEGREHPEGGFEGLEGRKGEG